jgi:hypothetical protein
VLVMAGMIQGIFFGGDFPLMPALSTGVLALIAGFLLLGIAILAPELLPRWARCSLSWGLLRC